MRSLLFTVYSLISLTIFVVERLYQLLFLHPTSRLLQPYYAAHLLTPLSPQDTLNSRDQLRRHAILLVQDMPRLRQ